MAKIEINNMSELVATTLVFLVAIAGVIAVCAGLAFLFSIPVYFIWNWALVGSLTICNTISIYQAFGISLFISLLKTGLTKS